MINEDLSRRISRSWGMVIAKTWLDPNFKAEVLRNPKEALEAELGDRLPDALSLVSHQETSDRLNLVLPEKPAALDQLSDAEILTNARNTDSGGGGCGSTGCSCGQASSGGGGGGGGGDGGGGGGGDRS
jgi:uncharacterized membrane protein YgcG